MEMIYLFMLVCAILISISLSLSAEQELALSVLPNEGNLCNAAGSSWYWSETLVSGAISRRVIRTNTCPNHYSVCQQGGCAGERVTRALRKDVSNNTYHLPLYPEFVAEESRMDTTCLKSPVAIALNGVPIYSMADKDVDENCVTLDQYDSLYTNIGEKMLKRCSLNGVNDGVRYCGDIVKNKAVEMDKCGGFTDDEGQYRYHTVPICLVQQLEELRGRQTHVETKTLEDGTSVEVSLMSVDRHSVMIAWALDGFPVYYGAKGPKGIVMRHCSTPSADPHFCLDECGGFEGALPEVDEYMYRYYIQGPLPTGMCATTTEGLGLGNSTCARVDGKCCLSEAPPVSVRPYTIGCFKGCVAGAAGCVYAKGKKGTSTLFTPEQSVVPETVFFGVSDMGVHGGSSGAGADVPAPTPSPAPADSALPLPLAGDRVKAVAVRLPDDRKLGLYAADGTGSTLPSTPQDVFVSGVVVDRVNAHAPLTESQLLFTTQKEIMAVSAASEDGKPMVPFPVLSSVLEVTIVGYNLGADGMAGTDVTVSIQGERCTSLVRVNAHRIECNVLTLADPMSPVATDVSLKAFHDITTGLTAHPTLVAVSGKAVMSDITFTHVPFTPYALGVSPDSSNTTGWIYWSNVGHRDAAGLFRARRSTDQLERLQSSSSAAHVLSLAIYRPEPESVLEALLRQSPGVGGGDVEVMVYSDARSGKVRATTIPLDPMGCGRSCDLTPYTLIRDVQGVVSVTVDHWVGQYARLLVASKDGDVWQLDLETLLIGILTGTDTDVSIAPTSVSMWPDHVTRLASLSSRARLGGIAAVIGPNPSPTHAAVPVPDAWTFQRIFFMDTNRQRIYAVAESGEHLVDMQVGNDLGRNSLVWPHQLSVMWTPPSDVSDAQRPSITVLAAEYLGKIWRFELSVGNTTGKIDHEQYRTSRPVLVADMSNFAASQMLRTSIGADIAAGKGIPTTFFEAYG